MDRDKLKFLIRNLELTLDALKVEVYSDVSAYQESTKLTSIPTDYDELYDDDDGYTD